MNDSTLFETPVGRVLARARAADSVADGSVSLSHGFLPERLHVEPMPMSHVAWEEMAARMPSLVFDGNAQQVLENMPLLSARADALPDRYVKRATIIMGLLACSYWRFGVERFFSTRNSDISDYLPPCIMQPWVELCQRLGRPRQFQSMDDLLLDNFQFRDGSLRGTDGSYEAKDVRVDRIKNLVPAFDNEAERVFYSTIVEVHAASAPLLRQICAMQAVIMEGGIDAADQVSLKLEDIYKSTVGATRAIMKANPNARRRNYCSPTVFSKTMAIFNVPPVGYPSSLSGSAAPFVHTMDALVGRLSFDSKYGKFSKMLEQNHLSRNLLDVVHGVREVPLRGYIERMREADPVKHGQLSAGFNAIVEALAGPKGFLGKHLAKVFLYLGVGTLLGRNQSTSGDQRYVSTQSWVSVTQALQISSGERLSMQMPPAAFTFEPTVLDTPEDLPQMSFADVVAHRTHDNGWLILNDGVFDVTKYLKRHPGGSEIIEASLGRDGTADYHLIPGHASAGSRRMLARLRVANIEPISKEMAADPWYQALDFVLRTHNTFRFLERHKGTEQSRLAYVGQSYSHFCDEHLHAILGMVSDDEARRAKVRAATDAFLPHIRDAIQGQLTGDAPSDPLDLSGTCVSLCNQFIDLLLPPVVSDAPRAVDALYQATFAWLASEAARWSRPSEAVQDALPVTLEAPFLLPTPFDHLAFSAEAERVGWNNEAAWLKTQALLAKALKAVNERDPSTLAWWIGTQPWSTRDGHKTTLISLYFAANRPLSREDSEELTQRLTTNAPWRADGATSRPDSAFATLSLVDGSLVVPWTGPPKVWTTPETYRLSVDAKGMHVHTQLANDAHAHHFVSGARHAIGQFRPDPALEQDRKQLKMAFGLQIAHEIIEADGVVTTEEAAFLLQAFPEEERQAYWISDADELADQFAIAEVELPGILSHHEKLAMLSTFYAACAADGDVDPAEIEVLRHACATLGLDEHEVEENLKALWDA